MECKVGTGLSGMLILREGLHICTDTEDSGMKTSCKGNQYIGEQLYATAESENKMFPVCVCVCSPRGQCLRVLAPRH